MTENPRAVTGESESQSTGGGDSSAADFELKRAEFQRFLDNRFPIGAMCAILPRTKSHLDATASVATGRLVSGAAERDARGRWWHELVIDSRGNQGGEAEVVALWVSVPQPLAGGASLWESEVRPDSGVAGILRLNADPPEPWRPTVKMREEVTEAYADHWPRAEESS